MSSYKRVVINRKVLVRIVNYAIRNKVLINTVYYLNKLYSDGVVEIESNGLGLFKKTLLFSREFVGEYTRLVEELSRRENVLFKKPCIPVDITNDIDAITTNTETGYIRSGIGFIKIDHYSPDRLKRQYGIGYSSEYTCRDKIIVCNPYTLECRSIEVLALNIVIDTIAYIKNILDNGFITLYDLLETKTRLSVIKEFYPSLYPSVFRDVIEFIEKLDVRDYYPRLIPLKTRYKYSTSKGLGLVKKHYIDLYKIFFRNKIPVYGDLVEKVKRYIC